MSREATSRFSPELRERAVRMVLEHEKEYASLWAAMCSVAAKIGCTGPTMNERVKKAEVDGGIRAGIPTEMAERMKALEREVANSDRPMNSYARLQRILRWRSSTAGSS